MKQEAQSKTRQRENRFLNDMAGAEGFITLPQSENPCYLCKTRAAGCHAGCAEYAEYIKKLKAHKESIKKAQQAETYDAISYKEYKKKVQKRKDKQKKIQKRSLI